MTIEASKGGVLAVGLMAAVAVACSSSGTSTLGDAGADSGGSGGSGQGGSGGTSGKGGAGGSGQGGVAGTGNCPPCVPPPSPDCVGTGPCGCGPYECPGSEGVPCGDGSTSGPFDRSCTDSSECTMDTAFSDCCGTLIYVAIARSDSSRFSQVLSQCRDGWPACGCAPGPPTSFDGLMITNESLIGPECVANQCTIVQNE